MKGVHLYLWLQTNSSKTTVVNGLVKIEVFIYNETIVIDFHSDKLLEMYAKNIK